MKKVVWLLPLVSLLLAGADISGKWAGAIEVGDSSSGSTVRTPVLAEFMQKSAGLSGKISRRGDDDHAAIRNGKIEGKKVMFECSSAETTTPMKFTLTLDGDRLVGEMKGSVDEGEIVGKVELTREKAGATLEH